MKCLYPLCDREERSRGLCYMHYNRAQRMVKERRTTWKQLEERGRCLKPKYPRVLDNFAKWALGDD